VQRCRCCNLTHCCEPRSPQKLSPVRHCERRRCRSGCCRCHWHRDAGRAHERWCWRPHWRLAAPRAPPPSPRRPLAASGPRPRDTAPRDTTSSRSRQLSSRNARCFDRNLLLNTANAMVTAAASTVGHDHEDTVCTQDETWTCCDEQNTRMLQRQSARVRGYSSGGRTDRSRAVNQT